MHGVMEKGMSGRQLDQLQKELELGGSGGQQYGSRTGAMRGMRCTPREKEGAGTCVGEVGRERTRGMHPCAGVQKPCRYPFAVSTTCAAGVRQGRVALARPSGMTTAQHRLRRAAWHQAYGPLLTSPSRAGTRVSVTP